MPAFVFLGGPECGVDSVVMFGVALPLGVPVEVTEARAVQKLRHNRFFVEVETEPQPEAGPDEDQPGEPPVEKKRRGRPPRV